MSNDPGVRQIRPKQRSSQIGVLSIATGNENGLRRFADIRLVHEFVRAQREDFKAPVAMPPGVRLDLGHFLAARATERGPEAHQRAFLYLVGEEGRQSKMIAEIEGGPALINFSLTRRRPATGSLMVEQHVAFVNQRSARTSGVGNPINSFRTIELVWGQP